MAQNLNVVVGLGVTGISCARYLQQQGFPVAITDSRTNPPGLEELLAEHTRIPVTVGKWDTGLLERAERIILSPGVSLKEPAIVRQIARGVPVIGDIELFAQNVNAAIIAITGTNAKSTVTTLVGEMAKAAGIKVQVGGNLGTPALELLKTPDVDLFVLELSSFQLETTYTLKPKVATILNLAPDHMDRYATLQDYYDAKKRIYSHCEMAVCNRDDVLTECDASIGRRVHFTLGQPKKNEFGLLEKSSEMYLAFEDQPLLAVKELPLLGRHYQANALAALAIGYSYGLPMEAMLKTLREFKGLAHRCQLVRERNQVAWYNDSKGTNVGATLAAIEGLGSVIRGKLVLIAGGMGKNADFSPLVPAILKFVKTVVLIGEDAPLLAKVIDQHAEIKYAQDMQEAVAVADALALPGDCVLLSPACASFDMFQNFEHRGEVFAQVVESLKA